MTLSGYPDDVEGTSHSDVWAVGTFGARGGQVEHFDGSHWTQVAVPVHKGLAMELRSVNARTTSDAWAVGNTWGTAGRARTLIVHWDGSTWTKMPSPNLGFTNLLMSVSADSATDAWAVGAYHDGFAVRPLALHWDGTTWTLVDIAPASGLATAPGGRLLTDQHLRANTRLPLGWGALGQGRQREPE